LGIAEAGLFTGQMPVQSSSHPASSFEILKILAVKMVMLWCEHRRWRAERLLLWAGLPLACRWPNGCQYDCRCTIAVENRTLSVRSALNSASPRCLQSHVTFASKHLQDSLQSTGTNCCAFVDCLSGWEQWLAGMLMRPAKCEADAKSKARYHKAEVEVKAKNLRGRGGTLWGRGRGERCRFNYKLLIWI